jgi:serine/threonine-protein kinase
MSPEQARGKALDRRTDTWSFGCCFYEALTGRKAFVGETVPDVLAAILEKEPDWTALPVRTPLKVQDLLRRCLQKERNKRLQHIGDARIEIEEALEAPGGALAAAPSRQALPLLIALAIALAAGIALWSLARFDETERRVVSRFALHLPPEEALTHLNDPVVAWSPDGTRLVYLGGKPTRLHVRPLDQMSASVIPGTENAISVFVSPDGQWVGFYGRGKLEKVHLGGGTPVELRRGEWLGRKLG